MGWQTPHSRELPSLPTAKNWVWPMLLRPSGKGRSCGDGKAVPPQPASLANCQARASVLHSIPRASRVRFSRHPCQKPKAIACHPNDEASLMANCKSFLKSSDSRQHLTFFTYALCAIFSLALDAANRARHVGFSHTRAGSLNHARTMCFRL